jgi:hypothetical protein
MPNFSVANNNQMDLYAILNKIRYVYTSRVGTGSYNQKKVLFLINFFIFRRNCRKNGHIFSFDDLSLFFVPCFVFLTISEILFARVTVFLQANKLFLKMNKNFYQQGTLLVNINVRKLSVFAKKSVCCRS